MSTRFLPRGIGSIDTGPQIFTKTDTPNTTISFTEALGLLNSVRVENGAIASLNGIYTYVTEYFNKPYYNKDNNGNLFIVYDDTSLQWSIYDFSLSEDPMYFSNITNVNYPWNVLTWYTDLYPPAPTVTKIL